MRLQAREVLEQVLGRQVQVLRHSRPAPMLMLMPMRNQTNPTNLCAGTRTHRFRRAPTWSTGRER